jgi:peptidoglycan/LPS O-acetylase OafA/YrhL
VANEAPDATEAAPAKDAGARFYHPELDGLRFVAFLLVFIHHVAPPLDGPGVPDLVRKGWNLFRESGGLGVDLFFCLSAYLITMLLRIEWERTGGIDIGKFYLRRLLRIWPLYFAFLGLVLVLPSLGIPQGGFGAHAIPFLLLVGNWSCAFHGYPGNAAAPLWSVSLEEQFYILWPPLLRWATPARLGTVAAVMIAVAVLTRVVVAAAGWTHPATWCATLTRLDSLAVGILLAVHVGGEPRRRSGLVRWALFGSGILLWLVAMRFWHVNGAPSVGHAVAGYPLFALGSGLMLLAVLASAGGRPGPLGCGVLVYLGKVSYGLYVFHQLAAVLARRVLPDQGPWIVGALGFGITVALAAVSYAVLERPFLLLKERFSTVKSRPA